MIEQQAPPGIEMETFDWNPLEYLNFVNLLRKLMKKWIQDPKGRLLRLLNSQRDKLMIWSKLSQETILHWLH